MDPMLAQKGTMADLERPGYLVDEKVDGHRCICSRVGDVVTLTSREGNDMTDRAPGVVAALLALPCDSFVIDAELVTYDDARVARLPLMLHDLPRHLVAFDLLVADGYDVREMRLSARKRLLSVIVGNYTEQIRTSKWRHSGLKGMALYQAIVADGGEGVICKLAEGQYRSGRSCEWLKYKPRYGVQQAA